MRMSIVVPPYFELIMKNPKNPQNQTGRLGTWYLYQATAKVGRFCEAYTSNFKFYFMMGSLSKIRFAPLISSLFTDINFGVPTWV